MKMLGGYGFDRGIGAQQRDIGAQRLQSGAILFDEGAMRSPARKRFEAKRAGAREQVDHLQAFEAADPAGQDRKERLACAIAGGAGPAPSRGLQRTSPPFARDDAHVSAFSGLPMGAMGARAASACLLPAAEVVQFRWMLFWKQAASGAKPGRAQVRASPS